MGRFRRAGQDCTGEQAHPGAPRRLPVPPRGVSTPCALVLDQCVRSSDAVRVCQLTSALSCRQAPCTPSACAATQSPGAHSVTRMSTTTPTWTLTPVSLPPAPRRVSEATFARTFGGVASSARRASVSTACLDIASWSAPAIDRSLRWSNWGGQCVAQGPPCDSSSQQGRQQQLSPQALELPSSQ